MGTFVKGVLGGFKGKVGSVIGTKWKGLSVMRINNNSITNNSGESKLLIGYSQGTPIHLRWLILVGILFICPGKIAKPAAIL